MASFMNWVRVHSIGSRINSAGFFLGEWDYLLKLQFMLIRYLRITGRWPKGALESLVAIDGYLFLWWDFTLLAAMLIYWPLFVAILIT